MFKALCRPLLDEFIQSGLVYISSGFYSVMSKYVEKNKKEGHCGMEGFKCQNLTYKYTDNCD